MSKYTFNFSIKPGAAVDYAVTVSPFHAVLREATLALTTNADDSDEEKLREQADQVAHDLARSLSYERTERFLVAYLGRHVIMPTGQQRVSASFQITVNPAPSVDFQVRDAAGSITDSTTLQRERERLAAQQRLVDRAIRAAADPNFRDMLEHWARYGADPDGHLHPLYDVLQVAERLFGGRKQAASALHMSEADLDRLGRISNNPTILTGRHPGKSQGPHRIAADSEVNICERVARTVIEGYAAKIAVPRLIPNSPEPTRSRTS
jgi:hypothetical protein